MNLERRVAFIERAIQCLRCSQGNSTTFEGITPTFTTLTASDIGATSTSTPEEIRQLLSDYITANPIIIGQNEIRYIQVDGNTYVIQNEGPGTITSVQPSNIIPIGGSSGAALDVYNKSEVNSKFINNTSESLTSIQQPTLVGNILTLKYIGENGTVQEQTVDLSNLATIDVKIEDASYNASTNIITLTDSTGATFNIDLSEFSILTTTNAQGITTLTQEGVTKLVVSKVGQTGSYNDLLDKPVITVPTKTSDLTNDGANGLNPFITIEDIPETGIQSIQAGDNITIDNTDPLNPIVNSTGGEGGEQKYIPVTGNITLNDTYHSAKVGIRANCIITVPNTLRSDFTCVFDVEGDYTATFTEGASTMFLAPYGKILRNNRMCVLYKRTSTEYRLTGNLATT